MSEDLRDRITAAGILRQAIEALPEDRRQHWEYRATSVYMNGNSHGQVKSLTGGPSVATSIDGAHGEYIALLDPTVGAALADLLRRLAAFRLMEHGTRYPSPSAAAAYDDVERASYALEQAIERRQG